MSNEPDPGIIVQWLHHTDLVKNGWNPSEMSGEHFEALVKDLTASGKMVQPLLVIPHQSEAEKWMIVDGEKRYEAGMEAGIEWYPVVVEEYTETEAKIRTLAMNNIHGESVPLRLAHLLVDLYREYTAEEIAALTGVGKDEQTDALKELEVEIPVDDGPVITVEDDAVPVEVTILLMPEYYEDFEIAMHRALGVVAEHSFPLVGEDKDDWSRAMRNAQTLLGVKLRNAALSAMVAGWLELTDEQKARVKARLESRGKPEITIDNGETQEDIPL